MGTGRTLTYTLNMDETTNLVSRLIRDELQFAVAPHREPGYWQVSYVTRSTKQEAAPDVSSA